MLFLNGLLPDAEVAVAVMGLTQNISSLLTLVRSAGTARSVGTRCSRR